ncbi:MAG: hypothetical protein KJ625_05900 [Actinobacteria bacterium]|nr:hypothetical protein [Actinomycetota bacterium]
MSTTSPAGLMIPIGSSLERLRKAMILSENHLSGNGGHASTEERQAKKWYSNSRLFDSTSM